MNKLFPYTFYKGLRFRIGAIFGALFLVCLVIAGWFLYINVSKQLERSFAAELKSSAATVLAKTETAPLIVPLPDSGNYFLLTYQTEITNDTLFNNLPVTLQTQQGSEWRSVQQTRTPESGGVLRILYAQKATGINDSLARLKHILLIYLPLSLMISFIAAYFLSGFLLRPMRAIIDRAKSINLQSNTRLLDIPSARDELHELTSTLNSMLNRIQQQAGQQTNFFAAAAHELRTPLSNMLTELQVMEAGALSNETMMLVKSQVAEVQRLKKLVNDFLLMSQLKTGTLPINKTAVNLVELCSEEIERFSTKAAQNGQRFKMEATPEDGDFTINADYHHAVIILRNLLANAVKFATPSSVISVAVACVNGSVQTSIGNSTSTGVITEDLTKEFVRKDPSKEGVGLGLWLTAQLLSMNGAKLHFNSSDKYFTAVFSFPGRGV